MRRGTPEAELFGALLATIRTAGRGKSMRAVGERIGAAAATVSQIEKGQRALKKPKLPLWAGALELDEADLALLWELSQGWIPVGPHGMAVFYIDEPEVVLSDEPYDRVVGPIEYASLDDGQRLLPMRPELGTEALRDELVPTVQDRPGLEPIYRLAEMIAGVLRRVLPDATIQVQPDKFKPPYIERMALGLTLTAAEEDENAQAEAEFVPLPMIECSWPGMPTGREQPSKMSRGRVRVPFLRGLTPIVRQPPAKSVTAVELEDLIRDLSGPERERVRGYVEAIIEQRADRPGA